MSALTHRPERPVLALLEGGNASAPTLRWFCGHCATRPVLTDVLPSVRRVCGVCGFGLLLQARSDEVPGVADAYLVVDGSFAVQALSTAAEAYLGTSERSALNRHVTELLIPADRSAAGSANFAVAMSMAARGGGPPSQAMVCRTNAFGERLRARISACGPPPAALLVLARGEHRTL